MLRNPFVPSFGRDPYILVGRDEVLQAFEDAFAVPDSNEPALATLITGQRGVGKTVLLNAYEHAARNQGWLVISESARAGLLERLAVDHLSAKRRELEQSGDGSARRVKSAGISAAGFGANLTWDDTPTGPAGLRAQVESLCAPLQERETGLVITLDEVHSGTTEELGRLGDIVQFASRQGLPLAFAAAGLKIYMDDFLNEKGTTFLRRAERFDLSSIEDTEAIAQALVQTAAASGKNFEPDGAARAANHTGGYPFLIQLVGAEAWKASGDRDTVTLTDVENTKDRVRRQLGQRVHNPSLHGLSDIDKSYLLAMSLDDGPSQTSKIAERLQVAPNYAGVYRSRLIRAGLIEEAGRGKVRFTIPYLRDYLMQDSAHAAMGTLGARPRPRHH